MNQPEFNRTEMIFDHSKKKFNMTHFIAILSILKYKSHAQHTFDRKRISRETERERKQFHNHFILAKWNLWRKYEKKLKYSLEFYENLWDWFFFYHSRWNMIEYAMTTIYKTNKQVEKSESGISFKWIIERVSIHAYNYIHTDLTVDRCSTPGAQ